MDWGKLLHKIRGAIAIPLFSNLCGRVCKSFGDIGKKFANGSVPITVQAVSTGQGKITQNR